MPIVTLRGGPNDGEEHDLPFPGMSVMIYVDDENGVPRGHYWDENGEYQGIHPDANPK